jgi:N-acylneuraminate cytidylyltransferase
MIGWSIRAAQMSDVIDRVVVSTDDMRVAEVARNFGAEVPFERPSELADDFTPTVPVVAHAIQSLQKQGVCIEAVCCLYATAPFARAPDIAAAYEKWRVEAVTGYVFTAARFSFPIERAFRMTPEGFCRMIQPDHYYSRSQDLVPAYQDAGQFYWGHPAAFLSGLPFFADTSKPYVLPRYRVEDIDSEDDWQRAERLFRAN